MQLSNRFMNCIEGRLDVKIKLHPSVDAALLKFDGFTTLGCSSFPVFAKNVAELKQGKFLCRLGFPFPEFKNFAYDPSSDTISWTATGPGFYTAVSNRGDGNQAFAGFWWQHHRI